MAGRLTVPPPADVRVNVSENADRGNAVNVDGYMRFQRSKLGQLWVGFDRAYIKVGLDGAREVEPLRSLCSRWLPCPDDPHW